MGTIPGGLRQYLWWHASDERHQTLHISPDHVHSLLVESLTCQRYPATVALSKRAENELLDLWNTKTWMHCPSLKSCVGPISETFVQKCREISKFTHLDDMN